VAIGNFPDVQIYIVDSGVVFQWGYGCNYFMGRTK